MVLGIACQRMDMSMSAQCQAAWLAVACVVAVALTSASAAPASATVGADGSTWPLLNAYRPGLGGAGSVWAVRRQESVAEAVPTRTLCSRYRELALFTGNTGGRYPRSEFPVQACLSLNDLGMAFAALGRCVCSASSAAARGQ